MFSGIVEEVGKIKTIKKQEQSAILEIEGANQNSVIFDDLKLGDSVAVNGVCLTVTSINDHRFLADVMHETLDRSSLEGLKSESLVNLERAMPAYGRFGGHIVSGHIDGTGQIEQIKRDSNAVWYKISANTAILRYVVEKGSIAVDGISLTVAKVSADSFCVSVIPHTLDITILGSKKVGSVVNLENDIIAKYVEKLMQSKDEGSFSLLSSLNSSSSTNPPITAKFLAENGFL